VADEVKLPRLGQGMESGTIVKWLKAEGDQVEKGEPLYELDTDKVTQEVEAEASGVLLKITVAEGEADVGTTIAVIGEQGEDVSAIAAAATPQVAETTQEEGSPGLARQPERERAREVTAAEQVAEARPIEQGNGAGARIKEASLDELAPQLAHLALGGRREVLVGVVDEALRRLDAGVAQRARGRAIFLRHVDVEAGGAPLHVGAHARHRHHAEGEGGGRREHQHAHHERRVGTGEGVEQKIHGVAFAGVAFAGFRS